MKLKIYNIMCDKNYAHYGSISTTIRLQLAPHGTDNDNMRIALAWARDIACDDLKEMKEKAKSGGIDVSSFSLVPKFFQDRYVYNIDCIGISAEYYVVVTEVDLSFIPCIFARDEFEDYDTSHLSDDDIEMMVADAEDKIWNDDAFLYAFNAVKQRIAEEYKLIKK